MPFITVIAYRKRIRILWLVGPVSFLLMLFVVETSLRFGIMEHRFSSHGIGKGFASHPLLFWIQTDERNAGDSTNERQIDRAPMHASSSEQLQPPGPVLQTQRGEKVAEPKPSTLFRVMIMGGSNAKGHGLLPEEDSINEVLAKKTEEKYSQSSRQYEFINAAQLGYRLFQNLVTYYLYLRKHDPDLIVYYGNINDCNQNTGPYTYREMFELITGLDLSKLIRDDKVLAARKMTVFSLQEILRTSKLYNLFAAEVIDLRKNLPVEKDVNPVEDYEKNLVDFIFLLKKDNCRVLFADPFNFTNMNQRCEEEEEGCRPDQIIKAWKKVMTEFGMPSISIQDRMAIMDNPIQYIQAPEDIYHLNVKGHRVAGELIFEQLVNEELLKK